MWDRLNFRQLATAVVLQDQMYSSQMSAVQFSEGAWVSPEQSIPEKVSVDMFLKLGLFGCECPFLLCF